MQAVPGFFLYVPPRFPAAVGKEGAGVPFSAPFSRRRKKAGPPVRNPPFFVDIIQNLTIFVSANDTCVMLYGKLIKPLLFSLPPEQAHHIVMITLSIPLTNVKGMLKRIRLCRMVFTPGKIA